MAEPFLVKDINPGSGSSFPGYLTVIGDTLYFTANDDIQGDALWKSDGTEAGTVLVKVISNPRDLTAVGDTLYFRADNGVNGRELYRSDGTEVGTVLVKDINPSSIGPGPYELTAIGDSLYFRANDDVNGWELWRSDGTEGGTILVKDINPVAYEIYDPAYGMTRTDNSSFPTHLTVISDTLYFSAMNGINGRELWKSDGTEAGTFLVKDINQTVSYSYGGSWGIRPNGSSLSSLTAVGDTLYFSANDGINGHELWKSDGTEAGTVLVKDINPGDGDSSPGHLTAIGETLYFSAKDGLSGHGLWKSDGTEAGTVLVKGFKPGSGYPSSAMAIGDTLYFTANEGIQGDELWKSDGTEAGTVLVKDINPGRASSRPHSLTPVGETFYFVAFDQEDSYVYGPQNQELWKSDGTKAGTILVKDINPGSESSGPGGLTVASDTLYFDAYDGVNGRELWSYTPSSPSLPPSTPFAANDLAVGIYNTDTDQLVTPLEDGDEFTTDELTGLLTLAATVPSGSVADESVGSLRLTLISEAGGVVSRVENSEPYAIFGDRGGDFFRGLPFGPGDYSLEVEVFSEPAGGGTELGSTNYNFSVLPGLGQQISIGFYNTTSDQQVASLQDGTVVVSGRELVGPITLSVTLPTYSGLRGSVSSMELLLTDPSGGELTRLENLEPYALFGDRDGDFFQGIEFVPGDYSLEVTAFSKRLGNGIAFGNFHYDFTVWSSPPLVLTGPIVAQPESAGLLAWGNGVNDLFHQWSGGGYSSGYAYGSNFGWSNADVFVYQDFNDPTSIADASGFAYTSQSSLFKEGDTVFFRGLNGFYGAWRIDDIVGEILYGQWYFQSDGSANFTASTGAFDADDLAVGIYNTQTDQLVTPLADGDVFRTDELTGLLTLAVTVPDGSPAEGEIGSVKLTFTDSKGAQVRRLENFEPYALFGDSRGDLNMGVPFRPPGEYNLEIAVFSEARGRGEELGVFNYDFMVQADFSEQSMVVV